jgi:hypothetical protein
MVLLSPSMSLVRLLAVSSHPFADRLGIKVGMAAGSLICVIGAAVQASSTTRKDLMAGRFILGLGAVIANSSGPAYVVEMAYPKYRGFLTGLYQAFFFCGTIIQRKCCRLVILEFCMIGGCTRLKSKFGRLAEGASHSPPVPLARSMSTHRPIVPIENVARVSKGVASACDFPEYLSLSSLLTTDLVP